MAEEVVESREWVMTAYAEEGLPTEAHLTMRTVKLAVGAASIPDGHVAIQVLWVSLDPYLRSRMTSSLDGLCLTPFTLGEVITSFGVGRIAQSKDARYSKGDMVLNPFFPVADYCIVPATMLRKLDTSFGITPLDYLNALVQEKSAKRIGCKTEAEAENLLLFIQYTSSTAVQSRVWQGVPGFTAWVGIQLIGNPKPGDNVFISAAAGAVGMFAGQLAKLRGCRVVGSTGTDEKAKLLREELKFDDAFNYKKVADFDSALRKYFPNGIDIYLDNVGGKLLEAVLNHVNKQARIPLCGMISQYNQVWTDREGVKNLLNIIGKEVRMEGFLINSYLHHFQVFTKEIEGYIKEGKLVSKIKIVEGIEGFLKSLVSLFSSSNVGKVILQVNK